MQKVRHVINTAPDQRQEQPDREEHRQYDYDKSEYTVKIDGPSRSHETLDPADTRGVFRYHKREPDQRVADSDADEAEDDVGEDHRYLSGGGRSRT
jgi:hypothetical protein